MTNKHIKILAQALENIIEEFGYSNVYSNALAHEEQQTLEDALKIINEFKNNENYYLNNNVKHTPYPWHVGTTLPNGEQLVSAENGLLVAVIATGKEIEKEETLANANLIAAAPELLKILSEIIHSPIAMDLGYYGIDAKKANAIINKATGKINKRSQYS